MQRFTFLWVASVHSFVGSTSQIPRFVREITSIRNDFLLLVFGLFIHSQPIPKVQICSMCHASVINVVTSRHYCIYSSKIQYVCMHVKPVHFLTSGMSWLIISHQSSSLAQNKKNKTLTSLFLCVQ